ncbi:roadblock/LC7 domain-containing protein [Streptomyces sp. NPDC058391]|uniref:roadblock/LC7 domain-containing protein n=1 Tax=Streptomyces sp. NPDC058391 TaxID=3346476 RepID=UPI0036614FE3
MKPTNALGWLLKDLIEQVPGSTAALISTADGIARHWHNMTKDDADTLSARTSGLLSLAGSLAASDSASGTVRQVVVELSGGMAFLSHAGEGAHLTVLADSSADPGAIGYQMTALVKSLPGHLAEPAREAAQ